MQAKTVKCVHVVYGNRLPIHTIRLAINFENTMV